MVIVLAHGNLYCINVSAAGRPRCGCGSIIHLFGTEVKQIMKKTAFFFEKGYFGLSRTEERGLAVVGDFTTGCEEIRNKKA